MAAISNFYIDQGADFSTIISLTDSNSDEVYKHVDYNQIIGLLVESTKELKEENNYLRSMIEELKDINR